MDPDIFYLYGKREDAQIYVLLPDTAEGDVQVTAEIWSDTFPEARAVHQELLQRSFSTEKNDTLEVFATITIQQELIGETLYGCSIGMVLASVLLLSCLFLELSADRQRYHQMLRMLGIHPVDLAALALGDLLITASFAALLGHMASLGIMELLRSVL